MTLRLKVGASHINHLQQYETLVTILSQAFGGSGGKSRSSSPTPPARGKIPENQAEAQRIFKSLFN